MKRGQKRTKNQKRRDARALRLAQNPDCTLRVLTVGSTLGQLVAAHNVYYLQGTDLITLKLWS
jgi:hypothetical protein